jgi:hypothetical protein
MRHTFAWLVLALPAVSGVACGSDTKGDARGLGSGGTHATGGTTGSGGKGTGGTPIVPMSGGTAGSAANGAGGSHVVPTSGGSAGNGGTDVNGGAAGTDTCAGTEYKQMTTSALDVYFVFDRTNSMGTDCAYVPGDKPPVASKACFATYALSDYLINVSSSVDTRLAFQFMSLAKNDCDGTPYETPLIPLTQLPVPSDHMLIQAISNETFNEGLGTHIEGALRGISVFTTAHVTPGREMIGVLMTDGDPNGCEQDVGTLSNIIADHLKNDGIRTFIIGMQGATDSNLERLATAGGADPHDDWCGSLNAPCHYWNVDTGAGDAVSSALSAIVQQAAPIPCEFPVSGFTPPAGQQLDFGKVNVTLTDDMNTKTQIGQVPDKASCRSDVAAWYYDDPAAPKAIELCDNACSLVTDAANGSRVSVVVGCQDTVVVPPIK